MRLFYVEDSGDILTVAGRALDTAETLTEAAEKFPYPTVFMTCANRTDFARVRDVARPPVDTLIAIYGLK